MPPTRIPSGAAAEMTTDGLRYIHKPKGCQFNDGIESASSWMSCFRCGNHRLRRDLVSTRILGLKRLVCAEPCKSKGHQA